MCVLEEDTRSAQTKLRRLLHVPARSTSGTTRVAEDRQNMPGLELNKELHTMTEMTAVYNTPAVAAAEHQLRHAQEELHRAENNAARSVGAANERVAACIRQLQEAQTKCAMRVLPMEIVVSDAIKKPSLLEALIHVAHVECARVVVQVQVGETSDILSARFGAYFARVLAEFPAAEFPAAE